MPLFTGKLPFGHCLLRLPSIIKMSPQLHTDRQPLHQAKVTSMYYFFPVEIPIDARIPDTFKSGV